MYTAEGPPTRTNGRTSGLDRGTVLAHEIGHYLGLYHLVETNGELDVIDDDDAGGPDGNLMTTGALGDYLSPGQARVIRGHPLVHTDTSRVPE